MTISFDARDLRQALTAWPGSEARRYFELQIQRLDPAQLPLQQGLTQGSHVADEGFAAMVIAVAATDDLITVKAGIGYRSLIAGCNCADDPTPQDTLAEYCVIRLLLQHDGTVRQVELVTEAG